MEQEFEQNGNNEEALVKMHFDDTKLSLDYINAFKDLYSQCYPKDGIVKFEEMRPAKLYEEHLQNRSDVFTKRTMELSDPEAVATINKLVIEFNEDLERIKRDRDIKRVNFFLKTIEELVQEKNN